MFTDTQQKPVTDTPAAQAPAGSILQQGNQFLSNAINLWGQVEQVKAQRATSGGDQVARQTTPEVKNGVGVTMDTTEQDKAAQKAAGVTPFGEINMKMLGFSVGVLALGLMLKAKGFK